MRAKQLVIGWSLAALLAAASVVHAEEAASTGERKAEIREKAKEAVKIKGRIIKNDAEIAKLRDEFQKEREAHLAAVQKLRDEFKNASDEKKAALREQLATLRTEWAATQKQNAQEVRERAKEIRSEFKNRERDRVIDASVGVRDNAKGR